MSILLNRHLISPNLVIIYIPSDSLKLPPSAPFNTETKDNIVSYYNHLGELLATLENINREGVNVSALSAWDFIEQLSNGDFYIGDGEIVWTEIGGEGVPTNWDGYGNNF